MFQTYQTRLKKVPSHPEIQDSKHDVHHHPQTDTAEFQKFNILVQGKYITNWLATSQPSEDEFVSSMMMTMMMMTMTMMMMMMMMMTMTMMMTMIRIHIPMSAAFLWN